MPSRVSREQVEAELAQLWRRSGLPGSFQVRWPAHMNRRHARCRRSHAQVRLSSPPVFEFAGAVCGLDARHREGLLAHEVGHVLNPEGGENGADAAAEQVLGVRIGYDAAWPDFGLQVRINPTEAWEPELATPTKAPRPPLPPELRPVRDAKRQAAYDKRMAKKAASRAERERWAVESAARTVPHVTVEDDDDLDDGPAERCLFCGQRAFLELSEYWQDRRFMIGTCCPASYEWWARDMEEWTPAEWQQFMWDHAAKEVRTVGGDPQLRDKLGVRPDDVFLADEPLEIVRTVSMKARRSGEAPPGALTIDELREYVRRHHKHAGKPPAGGLWGYAIYNGRPGEVEYSGTPKLGPKKGGSRPLNLKRWPVNLIGVALVGRPASRYTQQAGEAVRRVAAGETPEAVGAAMKLPASAITKWIADGVRPGEKVAEVSRVALDHDQAPFVTYKASSLIYETAAEDAKAAGFTKIQTFTLKSESGMSLRYARWKPVATERGGGQFSRKGRARTIREGELADVKTRWEKRLA